MHTCTRSYGVVVGSSLSRHKVVINEELCYEIYKAYCQGSGR